MECIMETSNMEFVNAKGKRVQIVRCIQCGHAQVMDGKLVCTLLPTFNRMVDPKDFCSWGEFMRRECE